MASICAGLSQIGDFSINYLPGSFDICFDFLFIFQSGRHLHCCEEEESLHMGVSFKKNLLEIGRPPNSFFVSRCTQFAYKTP